MLKNIYRGLLVCIDGANGSGKSTIIKKLSNKLIQDKIEVKLTKEPTNTKLGILARTESEVINGNALACLATADRYEHLKNQIIPALQEGQVVLCDRYVLSSFIFQGMDGVDYDFINDLNSRIIAPDIQIVLYASVDEIQNRLKERRDFTRFEKNNQTDLEIQCLQNGIKYLKNQNVNIYKFNTEDDIISNLERICNIIVSYIEKSR